LAGVKFDQWFFRQLVGYENWSICRAMITSTDQRQLATATAVGWIGLIS
jgi:hypothetical protein